MEQDELKIEATVLLVDLVPKTFRDIIFDPKKEKQKLKPGARGDKRTKLTITLVTLPVIEESGRLFLNPIYMIIGKQRIPGFMLTLLYKFVPDWFYYPVTTKIEGIQIRENELKILS